ncbi:MAG: pantoate--beta-alanine ligase [Muribaculaceae bacterium]|nr:pantoate--beta-alanine ligase [Muribaculaceae bacterium]MDE6320697.1 pantoate--beta-alanine ligase [Muribaculaceae bacterium]
MKVIRSVKELSQLTEALRSEGKSIGLVPTMGALHAGHRSLVDRSVKENDVTVVSVFVNPTQFNNAHDLATYPRTEEADCQMLEQAGADYAFVPSVEEMYPVPDTRQFDLGEVAAVMEGPMRPGHFNGVAQVVSRLMEYSHPTRAYFGEKDFQQIAVIRRMVELLGLDVEIVDCPIVREPDGLAMSSRNVRLTAEGRKVAPSIHSILAESTQWVNELTPDEVIDRVIALTNSENGLEVEYYQIVNALTMQPLNSWPKEGEPDAVGCITVYCGDVRLIDNIKYPRS